jgi:hypothetical protein
MPVAASLARLVAPLEACDAHSRFVKNRYVERGRPAGWIVADRARAHSGHGPLGPTHLTSVQLLPKLDSRDFPSSSPSGHGRISDSAAHGWQLPVQQDPHGTPEFRDRLVHQLGVLKRALAAM